jgi:SAM-dependent methyltransferase
MARRGLGRSLAAAVAAGAALCAHARHARDSVLAPEASSGADQWQRVTLNAAVRQHLLSLEPARRDAAEISGDSQAGLGWNSFTSLNFPAFDLCADLDPSLRGRFDVVVCEQVIEHVPDPSAAAGNLRGLCRPGGHVVVSTPFLIRVHELPAYGMRDYWRFTPRGLRRLLEQGGLTVDAVDAWGNRSCVNGNLDRWPAYRRWQSLRNEPDLPVQVWAFAHREQAQTAGLDPSEQAQTTSSP